VGKVVQQCLLSPSVVTVVSKTMLKLTTAAARRDLADLIRTVRMTKQRAVITRYGLPLVAIIPIEDLARLETRSADGVSKRAAKRPRAR
jgi:prevent-host-death family protein